MMYTESCCFCGKDGLKRENASLYEVNGWLHVCKTTPAHRSVNYFSGEQLATNYDFDNSLMCVDFAVDGVDCTFYHRGDL